MEVVCKRMKYLRLHVKGPEGRVVVSAPYGVGLGDVERFVLGNAGWIRKRKLLASLAPKGPVAAERQWADGEPLYVWGKKYALRLEEAGEYALRLEEGSGTAVLACPKASTPAYRKAWLDAWYRAALEQAVRRLLPEVEALTGQACRSWRIREMKTRWGTCAIRKRKLWLNLHLAKKPPECLRFILVHELGHFVSRFHDEAFYGFMDRFMPEWRRVRSVLDAGPVDAFEPGSKLGRK